MLFLMLPTPGEKDLSESLGPTDKGKRDHAAMMFSVTPPQRAV